MTSAGSDPKLLHFLHHLSADRYFDGYLVYFWVFAGGRTTLQYGKLTVNKSDVQQ